MIRETRINIFLLLILFAATVISYIGASDRFTWWMESFPIFIGLPIVVATYKRFQLTLLIYCLLTVHAIILLIGAHYTYAEVPLFNWLRDTYHLSRNHYDRLGHFVQGFIPALLGRELLLRTTPLKPGKWLFFIICLSCLGISALYELLEWQTAVWKGEGADAFLGTQGDPWDTQEDMFMALVGAVIGQLTLGKYHNGLVTKRMKEGI